MTAMTAVESPWCAEPLLAPDPESVPPLPVLSPPPSELPVPLDPVDWEPAAENVIVDELPVKTAPMVVPDEGVPAAFATAFCVGTGTVWPPGSVMESRTLEPVSTVAVGSREPVPRAGPDGESPEGRAGEDGGDGSSPEAGDVVVGEDAPSVGLLVSGCEPLFPAVLPSLLPSPFSEEFPPPLLLLVFGEDVWT